MPDRTQPETNVYLCSSPCGCAVGFASGKTRGKADVLALRRTLRDWVRQGYKIEHTTDRAALDEHMKTWGDCTHQSGQTEDDLDALLALRESPAESPSGVTR